MIRRSLSWIRRWLCDDEILHLESEVESWKVFSGNLTKYMHELVGAINRRDARIKALQELIRMGYKP